MQQPSKKQKKEEKYSYQFGLGNHFATEAVPNSLPKDQNSPQQCPKDLYAEQLSGTAFTVPRANNFYSWLYRIQPSVTHKPFVKYTTNQLLIGDFSNCETNPNQMRWFPPDFPKDKKDFVDGLITMAGAGDPCTKTGIAVHLYLCNSSMVDRSLYNSDGDFLIVPNEGTLDIRTEFGMLEVRPGEICVIQRAMHFQVNVTGNCRGYICEVYDRHFRIPDLGPIGANGNAAPRHFQIPVAAYERGKRSFSIISKFQGKLWKAEQDHSPFNVVAWHGNYTPYKYDLAQFMAIGTVSYDHPDPSIFTVLTAPSAEPGVAACDFAIFPPRWAVGEHTFRPPYYHRNVMSEYMGLIYGSYEAKQGGFLPGGSSLHSVATAHGPDTSTFETQSKVELKPTRVADNSLAFMFETTYMLKLTPWAQQHHIDHDYYKCWQDLKANFNE